MVKKKSILFDWKHWLGWVLSFGAILLFAHLIGAHAVHKNVFTLLGLLLVIVVVDCDSEFLPANVSKTT